MGCIEDEYNIENITFSDTVQSKIQRQGILKKNKHKKNKKNKRKSKINTKKVTFATSEKTSQKENEEEEEESENESEESNIKESSNSNTNNDNDNNEEKEKNEDNQINNEKKSSVENSNKSSDKKESKDEEEEEEKENEISDKNDSSKKSSIKISDKEESKENNFDENGSNEEKENEEKKKKKKIEHLITDDDWLAKFINETNEYNRKNINSSISPKDPIIRELIDSKEKDLIISSEDLVSYRNDNPSKKYKVLDLLDSGFYGKIFKAVNTLTKNLVAIKKTKKFLNIKQPYGQPIYINVKVELELIKKLCHPNIVKVYEVYDIREFYFIIYEYCKYGNLYDYFRFHLSEKQICILIYQILSGVLYLHEKNMIHRNLKLETIMVDHIEKDLSTSEPYFFLKIIDFSTCTFLEPNQKETNVVGDTYYMAPEVIEENYDEKCDIWSVGVILYMLITKKAPFEGKDKEKIMDKIVEEDYNKNSRKLLEFSDEVKDLLNKLLEKNPEKRPSAMEALEHPWFKKYNGRGAFSNFKFEDFNLIIDKLFDFKPLNKLQEIVLSFLVHNSPSNEENIKIMKIFRYLNSSGDCKLTKEELKKGLYKYRIKSEVNKMVDELFEKLEIKEENNYIDYEKFLQLCVDKKALFTKENLKNIFNYINYDKGEGITAQKIMKTFNIHKEHISEALFNDLIIKRDNNNDMIITFGEFERIIRS